MELKDIWPEITKNQKLDQDYNKNNRHLGNLKNRF